MQHESQPSKTGWTEQKSYEDINEYKIAEYFSLQSFILAVAVTFIIFYHNRMGTGTGKSREQ